MKNRDIQALDEPRIVKVICDKEGHRIGAVAENCVVKTGDDTDEILSGIARIYGDHLRRKAERMCTEE